MGGAGPRSVVPERWPDLMSGVGTGATIEAGFTPHSKPLSAVAAEVTRLIFPNKSPMFREFPEPPYVGCYFFSTAQARPQFWWQLCHAGFIPSQEPQFGSVCPRQ